MLDSIEKKITYKSSTSIEYVLLLVTFKKTDPICYKYLYGENIINISYEKLFYDRRIIQEGNPLSPSKVVCF